MYSTIIFDVDGTLIDTEKAVIGSLQKMLRMDYQLVMKPEDLSFVLGIPGSDSLPKLGITDIDRANERWNYFMKDFFGSIAVFAGIQELLTALIHKEITRGIVTSKTKVELRDDFEPFGLLSSLPYVVCADDTEKHKPHPEPILKFLEMTGAEPSTSIYIGDTIYDCECARDAGVDFALALWGCKHSDGIDAKYKLESPQDLLGLLQK